MHRNHPSGLFVGESHNLGTSGAEPEIFKMMPGCAVPRRFRISRLSRLGLDQEQFPLTKFAEGVGTIRICTFVQHANSQARVNPWLHVVHQPRMLRQSPKLLMRMGLLTRDEGHRERT